MSRERLSPIPTGLLEVDVAAFPIATEASFTLRPMSLDPASSGVTGQLWRCGRGRAAAHLHRPPC